MHIRVVQEVLGHTRVTTTERYTHVATLQMRDASERMGEASWGARRKAAREMRDACHDEKHCD